MKKKVFVALLTIVLSLSLSLTAFAEELTSTPSDTTTIIQSSIDGSIITPQTADSGYINADGVRLRATPSTSGTILGLLYYGTQLEVGDESVSGWYFVIVCSTGQTGYVAKQYVTITY